MDGFTIETRTNGSGIWSCVQKRVRIHRIEMNYDNQESPSEDTEFFGELIAYFNPREWSCRKDGLIYTDNLWMGTFRHGLKLQGFGDAAVLDVDYSEQGMQSGNYVSMDVGPKFGSEWFRRFPRKKLDKQDEN